MKNRKYVVWLIVGLVLSLTVVSINMVRDSPHEAVDKWRETFPVEDVKEYINLEFIGSDMRYIKLENGEILKLTLKKDRWGDWDVTGTEEVDPEEIAERLYRMYEKRKIPAQAIGSFLDSLAEDGIDTTPIRDSLIKKGVPLNEDEKEG